MSITCLLAFLSGGLAHSAGDPFTGWPVDCRPSDAIAVALRANVPIYVDRELMHPYGILPEVDVRTKRQSQIDDNEGDSDSEDLSAFSDFLSNF